MNLLKTFTRKRESAQQEAERELRKLAILESEGKAREADAERLEALLFQAGRSPEDFAVLASTLTEHRRLSAEVAGLPAAGGRVREIEARRQAHMEETLRLVARRQEEEAAIGRELGDAVREVRRIEAAQAELVELESCHGELLGIEPRDLDSFTLTYRSTVINDSDPAAPYLEVSRETFERESARRREIREGAFAEERERHLEAHQAWERALPRDYAGRLVARGRQPLVTHWGWGELVASGYAVAPDPSRLPALKYRQHE
jgi:hypothetical protein